MSRSLDMWARLKRNSRFYVLVGSGWLSLFILLLVVILIPGRTVQTIRLEQLYGFISLGFLYLALLATPLTKIFASFRYREEYLHARRAIGVSAFYFALLHASVTFFGQLDGVKGLEFIPPNYTHPLLYGIGALVILFIMAATSLDAVVDFMGFNRWKRLHRLVYIAGLLVVLHVYIIGTHFSNGRTWITLLIGFLTLLLFVLEAIRLIIKSQALYAKRFPLWLARSLAIGIGLLAVGYLLIPLLFTTQAKSSNIHAAHEQLAAGNDSQNNQSVAATDSQYNLILEQTTYSKAKLTSGSEKLNVSLTDKQNQLVTPENSNAVLVSRTDFSAVALVSNNDLGFSIAKNANLNQGDYDLYLSFQLNGQQKTIGVSLNVGP